MNERVSLNYQIQGHLVPNITLNYNHILCQLNDVMENQIEQISEIYGFNMSYVTTENTSNFYCICEFQSDFADENIQTFVTLLEFQAIKKSQCKNSQVNLQKVQHSLQNLFRSEASQIVSIWGITQELENIKEEPLLTLKIHLTLFEENFFQTNEKQKTFEELSKYNYQQWQKIQDKNNLKQEINKFQHYTSINDKCKNEDQEHKQHKICPNFIQLKNIISGHCPFPLEKYLNIEDKFKSQEELQNKNNDQQTIPEFKEFVLKNKNCNQSELNFLICKQIQELQSILVAQNKDACKHLDNCQQAINNNINPIALLNPLILIQNDIFPDNIMYQQSPQQQKHHQQQRQLQIQEKDINLQQNVSQQPLQPQFFPNNKNQNQNQNHNPNRTQFQNQINSPLQFQLQQQHVQDLQQVEQQLSINQNEHNNEQQQQQQAQQQEQFTEIQYPKTPNNSPVQSEHKERQNELNLENLQFNQHLAKLNSINKSFYEDDQFSATLFFNNQNPVSEILSPISNNLNSINQNSNFNYEKTQHLKNSFTQQLNSNSNNYNQFNQQQLQQQQYPINKGIKAFRKNSLQSPSIFEVSSQLLKQSKANRSYFRKKNSFQISQSLKLLDTPQLDLNFPQHKSSICTQNFELENNASNNNNNEITNNNLQLNQENQINQEGFGEHQNKFLDDRFHLDQNFNNNQENQKHNIIQQQQYKNNDSNNHNNDNQIQGQQKQQNNFIQSNLDLQQNNFNNETNFYLDPPQSNEQIKLQKQQISDNNNLNNYDFIDFAEEVNNNNNNNNQQKYQIQQQENQIQNQQYQQQQNKMDHSFSYDFQQQQQIQEDSFLTNNHNNEGKQNFYSNDFNQKNSSIQNNLNFTHRVQFENNQNQSNNFQKKSNNNNINNISTIHENQEFSSTTHSTNSLNNQNVSRNYPNNYNSDHNLSQMTNNQVRISNRKKNKSSSKSIAHSQKLLQQQQQQQQQSQSQEEINYQIQIYDQQISECQKTQTHQYLKNLDHDEDQQKILQQQHQFQQQCEQSKQNKKIKI